MEGEGPEEQPLAAGLNCRVSVSVALRVEGRAILMSFSSVELHVVSNMLTDCTLVPPPPPRNVTAGLCSVTARDAETRSSESLGEQARVRAAGRRRGFVRSK